MSYIRLENVNKYYKKNTGAEVHALKNLNLEIKKGELIAIEGVSGSGKSTLLHVLGCLDFVIDGEYYLNNERITNKSQKQLAVIRNRKIGFILQNYGLINQSTAVQNIAIPLLIGGMGLKHIKRECVCLLEQLGIGKLADRKVSQMSGGQKQRVAIARALVNKPDIILADEPTGSLDIKTSNEVMQLLKEINQQGKTVIIVTHDKHVSEICSRILKIEDGCLVNDILNN
ncbi:ABC transporter ATP-binding protein [Vallitalea sediminicola]